MNDNNERIKYSLVGIYKRFVDHVDPQSVMDLLIQNRVISPEDHERILVHMTRQERCRALLDKLLTTSHPRAFITLHEALKDNYSWIASELVDGCNKIRIDGQSEGSNNIKSEDIQELNKQLYKAQMTNTHKSEILNLKRQLKMANETIEKLEKHIIILENQIKTAASAVYRSEEILYSMEYTKSLDEVDNAGSMPPLIADNDSPKINSYQVAIIEPNEVNKCKKLPRYCQSSYDLWVGYFIDDTTTNICIKQLLDNSRETQFFSEALLLGKLKHPRITNLLGRSPLICPEKYIVLESSQLVNALSYLKCFRYHLPNNVILRWIVQLASGMEYMQNKRIIHRSILASNILVCSSGNSIKLTNFQNAISLDRDDHIFEVAEIPQTEYTAPEIISQNRWSLATDVWSFGLTALKMYIRGVGLFPEMTQNDIKEYFSNYGKERMEDFMTKHLGETKRIKETLSKCLSQDENDRPQPSELASFDNYEDIFVCNPFTKKPKFEHIISHKTPVRGLTSLNDILYAVFMSSSTIRCYDIKGGFVKLKSIKLGTSARLTLVSYFKKTNPSKVYTSSGQEPSTPKPFKFCSDNLRGLVSCFQLKCLYVFDMGQSVILRINVEHRKVARSWKIPESATCMSVTYRGSILVGLNDTECAALEYNSEGMLLKKLTRGTMDDGPWRALKVDKLHCLVLHGDFYSNLEPNLVLEMIDNDGVRSSGYGTLLFKNISDIANHIPSKHILLADQADNRIICIDRHLKNPPIEILNTSNGIIAPSRIYTENNLIFVGLTSGSIYCFQFV